MGNHVNSNGDVILEGINKLKDEDVPVILDWLINPTYYEDNGLTIFASGIYNGPTRKCFIFDGEIILKL